MAWYQEASFYHIYPLGLLGAPKQNDYGETVHRLPELDPWIKHIKDLGFKGLYIGPLFESVGHGYETTDYRKLDRRLGDNNDLKHLVSLCHENGIKVIFDGVFNHTGRDFFAFKDIQEKRESSPYRDWYCNVNFWGNNEYNDGFSYDNWGGYNLLVKLNHRNPAVLDYFANVVKFWIDEFDVDGIRLDAADVLDHGFMSMLRAKTSGWKQDFYLMGEVIHGEYHRWVNDGMLHAVTNYTLHKALYSGHNDHNYFEIAHTIKRLCDMGIVSSLYNFVDNHDVERIRSKVYNEAQLLPIHVLLYTLPGVPSIYYGSEFAIEGKKERGSDDSLRPALSLADFADARNNNALTMLIERLGAIRNAVPALSYGDYRQLHLTNRQFAYARTLNDQIAIVTVNNDEGPASFSLSSDGRASFKGLLSGKVLDTSNGQLFVELPGCSGDIWVSGDTRVETPVANDTSVQKAFEEKAAQEKAAAEKEAAEKEAAKKESAEKETAEKETAEKETAATVPEETSEVVVPTNIPYEEMTIEQLQAAILQKMANNGPVTEQMKRTVTDNTHHGSLINWVKSFR